MAELGSYRHARSSDQSSRYSEGALYHLAQMPSFAIAKHMLTYSLDFVLHSPKISVFASIFASVLSAAQLQSILKENNSNEPRVLSNLWISQSQ